MVIYEKKPTRVLSHENEDRRYDHCNGYLVLFNVGKEFNGVKARHDDYNSATDERKKHELDSTWGRKKSKKILTSKNETYKFLTVHMEEWQYRK